MSYELAQVGLSPGQSKKILEGMEKKRPVSVTLNKKNMEGGPYPLMLTKQQMAKFTKTKTTGKGCGLRLSPRQMKESFAVSEQMGTGFFSDAAKWIKKNVPKIIKTVAPIVKPLVKPAVGALANMVSPGSSQATNNILGSLGFGIGGQCALCPMCRGQGMVPFGQGMMPFGQGISQGLPVNVGLGNGMSPLGTGLGDDQTTEGQLALF